MPTRSPDPTGPLWQWSATDLAAAVRSRVVSPVEVVACFADRLATIDPVLQSFCTPTVSLAVDTAAALADRIARGSPVGPLAGVPVGVKDLIATRGIRTTSGSVAYASFVPDEDDVVVSRLRDADAIILGKTNTAEFGYGAVGTNPLFPATVNPWDVTRTPGGSSAGSAAAVSAGLVPFALGSDGGGSVRIPAALCGLVGVKASMGRVPLYPGCRDERYPGMSGWEGIEHIGPLARSVSDAALLLSVIAGPDPRDRRSIPCADVSWLSSREASGLRFGFSPDLGFASVAPSVAAVVASAVDALSSALARPVEALSLDWPDPQEAFEATVAMETDLDGLRALVAAHPGRMSPEVVRVCAREWTAEEFSRAIMARKALCNRMWRLMSSIDVLVTPTVAVTAFDPSAPPEGWSPFSVVANFTGQPAVTVPVGFADGLPVGVQLIGPHLGDEVVLAAARLVEKVVGPGAVWPAVAGA